MNLNIPFRPRLFDTLKGYTAKNFVPDLIAGVTVGIVALPLAMAFAIASGVKPEAGIFIAVVAGFIISALGGTKVSIGAPTGACTPVSTNILASSLSQSAALQTAFVTNNAVTGSTVVLTLTDSTCSKYSASAQERAPSPTTTTSTTPTAPPVCTG